MVEKFNFSTIPILDSTGEKVIKILMRPILRVRLCFNHKMTISPVNCAIDTGADINLFPASWAESIGIKIIEGKKSPIRGIGGIIISGYEHSFKLFIVNSKISFDTSAIFSYEHTIPLLGMRGFIDHFKRVTLDIEEDVFKLER